MHFIIIQTLSIKCMQPLFEWYTILNYTVKQFYIVKQFHKCCIILHVYIYIYIYIYIYPDTAKHQSKPQVYKSDIVRYKTCRRNRLQKNNAYLLQSAYKKVGEASDINKGFVFRKIY